VFEVEIIIPTAVECLNVHVYYFIQRKQPVGIANTLVKLALRRNRFDGNEVLNSTVSDSLSGSL
jgi:hypothetical protein